MIETLKDITSGTWVVIILISAVVLLNIVYVYQDIISKNQIHYEKMIIILYGILIIFNQIKIDRQKYVIERLCSNLLYEEVLKLEDLKKIREFFKNKKND